MIALWLVATVDGRHPRVIRAETARGALLSRIKDDEDVPRSGIWAAWQLGNFPIQFDIVDFDPIDVRDLGRPNITRKAGVA